MAELTEVISRAKFDEILARSNTSRERSMAEMRQLAEVIVPPPLPQPVFRDHDDDHVINFVVLHRSSPSPDPIIYITFRFSRNAQ